MQEFVSVVHRIDTGWHTFTSLQVPGLFLTGSDEHLSELRRSLPTAITALVAADSGRQIKLEEAKSLSLVLELSPQVEIIHFAATEMPVETLTAQAH